MIILRTIQTLGVPAFALLVSCTQGHGPIDIVPSAKSGSIISGVVRSSLTEAPLPYTRILISGLGATRIELSDIGGKFQFDHIDPGAYTISVDRAGFDTAWVNVPGGVNDTSFVDLKAVRLASVPYVKPLGAGDFRVQGTYLLEDLDHNGIYDPYRVKGAAFSPAPIGSSGGYNTAVMQRSFQYLDTLHANTIRTYNGATAEMLTMAQSHGIHVIVGFWVDTHADMKDPMFRRTIVKSFREFVRYFRTFPAVLMWNLGNEQNLTYVNGNNPEWYDLAEEMATAAFLEEGTAYHPVCISNGDVTNIGDPSYRADDASLQYVDLWASNIYRLNLAPSFATYRMKTSKPIVVTEFGIDALDNRTKQSYESVQMLMDSLNWTQISAASDVCVGGIVFEYTDEWWKAGDPMLHEYGGYNTGQHPDGYSNEEWWGLIAVTPDTNGDGMDEWRPRPAFRMFARAWQ